MSYGIQTFINGTSFDAINSIDFNYIIDIFSVASGSGEKEYPLETGITISASIYNSVSSFHPGEPDFSVSVSGNKVSWSFPHEGMIIVTGGY